MGLIGDIGDPKKDAAALQPLIDKAVSDLITGATTQVVPAIGKALQDALNGLQINLSRKDSSTG